MAGSLFDALKTEAPGGGSFGQKTLDLMRAKSGKATADTGPAHTFLAEEAQTGLAREEIQKALGTAGRQAQAQDLQAKSLQQEEDQKAALLDQQYNQTVRETQRNMDEVLNRLTLAKEEEAGEKELASIEQLGFLYGLQSKKYQDDLRFQGDRRRLDNKGQAELALQAAVFSDMIGMLEDDISFKQALNADQRVFDEYLASINGELAMGIAMQQLKTEAMQNNYEYMAKGISSAADTYESKKKKG